MKYWDTRRELIGHICWLICKKRMYSAGISNVESVLCDDKERKRVNFKLSRVTRMHKHATSKGQKKS